MANEREASLDGGFSLIRFISGRRFVPGGRVKGDPSQVPGQENNPISHPETSVIPDDLLEVSERLTVRFRELFVMEGTKRRFAIDFDLAKGVVDDSLYAKVLRNPPTREEWKVVVTELAADIHRVVATAKPDDPMIAMQRAFLIAKLRAHEAFYEGRAGIRIPWKESVKATQGVEPAPINPESKLAQREKVMSLFRNMGYKDLSKEEVERYRTENRISNEEFIAIIQENAPIMLDRLSSALNRQVSPNFRVETESANAYWLNWSDGNRDNFRLRVNTHARHADKKTPGKAIAMAAHEVAGHFGQMASWQQQIDNGKLIPVLGITSTHDPEQVASEGIAQNIHRFVPEILIHLPQELALAAEFELELEGLRQMIYNDFQIEANDFVENLDSNLTSEGKALKEEEFLRTAVQEIQKLYSAEPTDEVRYQFRERTEDPEKSVYLFAYGYGFLLHDEIGRILNMKERGKFLRKVYGQPLLPQQEIGIVHRLMENNPDRYLNPQDPHPYLLL